MGFSLTYMVHAITKCFPSKETSCTLTSCKAKPETDKLFESFFDSPWLGHPKPGLSLFPPTPRREILEVQVPELPQLNHEAWQPGA
jgi:hypothetical protein